MILPQGRLPFSKFETNEVAHPTEHAIQSWRPEAYREWKLISKFLPHWHRTCLNITFIIPEIACLYQLQSSPRNKNKSTVTTRCSQFVHTRLELDNPFQSMYYGVKFQLLRFWLRSNYGRMWEIMLRLTYHHPRRFIRTKQITGWNW